MSRRPPRGGRPHPGRAARRDGARPAQQGHEGGDARQASARPPTAPAAPASAATPTPTPAPVATPTPAPVAVQEPQESPQSPVSAPGVAAAVPAHPGRDGHGERDGDGARSGCTTAQMRRFIKSRAWIPMHELRRRFAIAGHDDEVVAVDLADRRVYVGLPPREGAQLGELLRSGDVGYELATDPATPIVVGVYPMRPVVRT